MDILVLGGQLLLFLFLFLREVNLDLRRQIQRDQDGDAHIMREIEKFRMEKGLD